jgi:flagellar biosynthetic protein FliR
VADVFHLSQAQLETLLLIFIRTSAMLFVFPIFSAAQIPMLVRFGLSALIAFIVYPTVPAIAALTDLDGLLAAVVSQIILGVVVGFVAYLVFMGIEFAGEIIDIQVGFAVANILNPSTQQQVTIIGELQLTLATLLFLISNSYIPMLAGIGGSFHLVPLPFIALPPALAGSVMTFVQMSVLIVFQIAAPAAVSLFLVNVALGLMSRVAPQMNVFVVGFPLQIGIGLVMLALGVPLLAAVAPQLFSDSAHHMDAVMRGMANPTP